MWNYIRKAFGLVTEEPDIAEPTDISYSYRGYAPLSVKVIERILTTGWNHSDIDRISGPKRVPIGDKVKLD